MKILQVSAIDMTMHNFLRPLNLKCREEGFEVQCVCSKGPFYEEIIRDGFKFHDVKIDRDINLISNLSSIIKLFEIFKIERPDIVHVHTPVASVLARIAAKIAGVPNIVYTAHGFYFHEGMSRKKFALYYNIEKYVGRYFTDYIFTQSLEDHLLAKEFNFLLPNKSANHLWIGNGIDLDIKHNFDFINPSINYFLRKKHSIPESHKIVSFIGRLVQEKGILDLLKAIEDVKNTNVTFIIIGSLPEGERDTETFEKLKAYKEHRNIVFTGQISNVEEYLYISDIFCLPSYREGMPRSIIEAMAMKNAILATNIRGSREEVVHNHNGYLFETNNSCAIAKYIDYLIDNPKLLSNMKNASFQRAKELYDENKIVQKQIEIFKSLREIQR